MSLVSDTVCAKEINGFIHHQKDIFGYVYLNWGLSGSYVEINWSNFL